MKTPKPAAISTSSIRVRIVCGKKIELGPGKVELLTLLAETGSISKSAKRMGMSYMKAWTLIQTMKPLVATARGGQTGGGAGLTDRGQQVIALYQKMEQDSLRACQPSWEKLQPLLKG